MSRSCWTCWAALVVRRSVGRIAVEDSLGCTAELLAVVVTRDSSSRTWLLFSWRLVRGDDRCWASAG